MQTQKRPVVYFLLALPIILFLGYAGTRSPAERATIFSEMQHKVLGMFQPKPEGPIPGLRSNGEFAAEYAGGGEPGGDVGMTLSDRPDLMEPATARPDEPAPIDTPVASPAD